MAPRWRFPSFPERKAVEGYISVSLRLLESEERWIEKERRNQ
jgi:hypothetical protein